jgi:integrase
MAFPNRSFVARTQRGARYGSETLVKRAGPNGDTWIAKWRDGGRQVQRGLGFVHSKRHPKGLTRAEAEAALGKLREQVAIERADERAAEAKRAAEEQGRTLAEVGKAVIAAKRAAGRKPSTIEAYSYWLRIHIIDFSGPMPVGAIGREDVRGFAAALERKGLAPKSRANALGTLHSLIEFAIDEGWATGENPVKRVKKPALATADADVHFLETEEVEALLRAVPDDALGRIERVMYLSAAMTGMRQGELFALRCATSTGVRGGCACAATTSAASSARPRRNAPRSVPLASRVATELELLAQDTPGKRDDDLVFAHPETGKPMGHRDFKTTLIHADHAPSEHEAEWVEDAFRPDMPAIEQRDPSAARTRRRTRSGMTNRRRPRSRPRSGHSRHSRRAVWRRSATECFAYLES